jgi:hypothetical protein
VFRKEPVSVQKFQELLGAVRVRHTEKDSRRLERLLLVWWISGLQSDAWVEGNLSGQPTYHHEDYPDMNPFKHYTEGELKLLKERRSYRWK